jgi:hypothetical protein
LRGTGVKGIHLIRCVDNFTPSKTNLEHLSYFMYEDLDRP